VSNRLSGSDASGTIPRDALLDPRQAASAKAAALRELAQRYRELAETLYNQDLIVQVQALVGELEDEAAELEVGRFAFFRAA
jgi:hypothetical protein